MEDIIELRISMVNHSNGCCSLIHPGKLLRGLMFACGVTGVAFFGITPQAQAQWLTQSIELKAGWNAVFLHVDASYDTLNALVGEDVANPILEVWRWNAQSVAQYVTNPVSQTVNTEWIRWGRSETNSDLQRLTGDAAYLVCVRTNVTSYMWQIKGVPIVPRHEWSISGLNLIGFSTVKDTPPRFDAFLSLSPELQSTTPEIFYYQGGDLGSNNPRVLPSLLFRNTLVNRGQAYWIRAGTVFNRYFGPFEVVQSGENGVDFGANSSASSFRLRNLTTNSLVVSLRLKPSETPPSGQSVISALPPLLLRGEKKLPDITYSYTNLPAGSPRDITLAPRDQPGSEVEVVLGLNRAAITEAPNSLLAGILSFTDSLGHSQVDMPVSARVASNAGLWIGGARVDHVSHYLKTFATNDVGELATGTNGNYLVSHLDTSLGAVVRPYPLRLIVYNPEAAASAVLLQQVFIGYDADTNAILSTREANLHPAFLRDARRVSAIHLPWSTNNTGWVFNGKLGQDTNLSTTVTLDYADQASNPFLHTYHPDHDNLDATFSHTLSQGSESYTVARVMRLSVQSPADDFSSLISGADTVAGDYQETITFKGLARAGGDEDTLQIVVSGAFILNRVSHIPALVGAP